MVKSTRSSTNFAYQTLAETQRVFVQSSVKELAVARGFTITFGRTRSDAEELAHQTLNLEKAPLIVVHSIPDIADVH